MVFARGLFGSSRRKLPGSYSPQGTGFMETAQERSERERLEQMLGVSGMTVNDGPVTFPNFKLPGNDQQAVNDYASMPAATAKPSSFWQGGDKFRWQDGLAGVLAAVGDAFSQQGGGQGGAVANLAGGRTSALELARKAQAMRQRLIAGGLNPAQADMVSNGDAKYGDVAQKEDDIFTRRMRMAGIDPNSPQGQTLLRQKLATDASPPPSLVGDASSGWTWQQPPAPSLPNLPTAPVGRLTPVDAPSSSPVGGEGGESEDQMMERLYRQQFGAQGGTMFQEWRRLRHRGS